MRKTLDDKRDKIGAEDDWQDLDLLRQEWPKWAASQPTALAAGSSSSSRPSSPEQKNAKPRSFSDRTAKAFFVPKTEIAENGYDLSINRYKEIVHEEETYDKPTIIIGRLKKLEAEIASDLQELEVMLG